MAYIYKPIRKIIARSSLAFFDTIFAYATLWLFKYIKISNYIILKTIVCCILALITIIIIKAFLKFSEFKNAFLLAYFGAVTLGVPLLPRYNAVSFGFCYIVYGIYLIIQMKNFSVEEYANQYDKIGSWSYHMSQRSKNVGLYIYAPCHILAGIIAMGFGIKEIIEIIF